MRKSDDNLLTPLDVSERLRIPLSTLYAWRQKRLGPRGVRVGRHLRYRQAEVERWLTELDGGDGP